MSKETSHIQESSAIRQSPSCLEKFLQDHLYDEELARQDAEEAITEELYLTALDRQEAEDQINEEIYEEELERQDEEDAIRDELEEEAITRQEADDQINEQICEEEFDKQIAEEQFLDSVDFSGISNSSGNSYRRQSYDDDFYDDYNPWDDYGRSGEKYGWYNGYSDDVIDDAFDGIPEATWNVD